MAGNMIDKPGNEYLHAPLGSGDGPSSWSCWICHCSAGAVWVSSGGIMLSKDQRYRRLRRKIHFLEHIFQNSHLIFDKFPFIFIPGRKYLHPQDVAKEVIIFRSR